MGILSVLGKVVGGLTGLSGVFGGAAKSSAADKLAQSQTQLGYDRLNLEAPGTQARTGLSAALAKNYTPRTVSWGGPGSGLRGELPTFSGGSGDTLRKAAADPMVAALLKNAMAGKTDTFTNKAAKSSAWDKILGGAAFGTSALGALFPKKNQDDSSWGGGEP